MTSTIWDTLADPPAIARESTKVHTPDPEDPEGEGTTETVYGPPLAKQSAGRWNRPWELELRLAPHLHAPCFTEGWAILRDETTPPSIPAGQKRGPDREQPVVDIEAGTATWWLLVDMTEQEIADKAEADAAAAKQALKDDAAFRRWEIETGGITRNGAAIATDQVSQSKIGGALQLVQADPQLVIRWKGLDGWVGMDATTVTYVAEQIGLHVQAAFAREEAICLAIDADTPVNILTGAIDGVGAWPT
jgi:hypothetical protein